MDQLTRREFIKKIVLYGGIASFGGQFFISDLSLAKALEHSGSIEPADYYRIVVLGDPHLPVREREVKDVFKQKKIIAAKNQVVNDINSWDDVNQIHVVGDVVAQFGNRDEYEDTKQYFAQFNKPLSFTTGNHDYIYEDCFSPEGKFLLASSESRSQKLNCFIETFGLTKLYFSQRVGPYLLVFLSPDSLESAYLTQMSEAQLAWFRNELKNNPGSPTIVFFHAPLLGTLLQYNKHVNSPNFIAQPTAAIEQIVKDYRQVFLWVSGHTHTPATNPSYASSVNVFAEQVTNIHNADMDREIIWTNSLYLYSNRVVVKTFNHKEKRWEEKLERTIKI